MNYKLVGGDRLRQPCQSYPVDEGGLAGAVIADQQHGDLLTWRQEVLVDALRDGNQACDEDHEMIELFSLAFLSRAPHLFCEEILIEGMNLIKNERK